MKLFAAIRQRVRRHTPSGIRYRGCHLPQEGGRIGPPREGAAERMQLDAAVRRQEHYNFLHYCGDAQPDPVETTQI